MTTKKELLSCTNISYLILLNVISSTILTNMKMVFLLRTFYYPFAWQMEWRVPFLPEDWGCTCDCWECLEDHSFLSVIQWSPFADDYHPARVFDRSKSKKRNRNDTDYDTDTRFQMHDEGKYSLLSRLKGLLIPKMKLKLKKSRLSLKLSKQKFAGIYCRTKFQNKKSGILNVAKSRDIKAKSRGDLKLRIVYTWLHDFFLFHADFRKFFRDLWE